MSLWTPSGEHPVGERRPDEQSSGASGGRPDRDRSAAPSRGAARSEGEARRSTEEDLDALRRQLADAPADVVVANHCYGLFELAAIHLSSSPPHLDDARLAIGALGSLVDGLGERLGDAHPSLREALAQIRLAYVQIAAARPEQPAHPEQAARPEQPAHPE